MKYLGEKTNLIKAAFILAALTVFAASCLKQGEKTQVPLTASETPEPPVVKVSGSTFATFNHKVKEHQQFECASCHRRDGKSKTLEYAGHDSCIGCHLNQFIENKATNENRAMCSICHSTLDSDQPPVRAFPAKFIEGFNMQFDHAAHDRGKGRPPQGCSSCHSPTGPGQSIQSGIDTHASCYTCHTPESKIGSCSVCHTLAPYNRTLQSNYSFRAIFRHGDHTSRQSVSCEECHNVNAGAPQGRQVSNITILEHRTSGGNNCLQCHNGRRAFTGNNPSNVLSCARCHKGGGPSSIPGTKLPEGTSIEAPERPTAPEKP